MHALDSHDTARFGVFASKEAVGVAFGLAVTLPGIPMLWMGDELGLGGRDGEDSRIPMPWGDLGEEQLCMFDMYKSLIALRRSHPVLSTGSLRWIAAGEDYVMFAREDSSDALVVVATRGPSCAQIPAHLLPGGHFYLLRGDAVLTASADKAWFTAERATLAIWKFAGVQRGFEQR